MDTTQGLNFDIKLDRHNMRVSGGLSSADVAVVNPNVGLEDTVVHIDDKMKRRLPDLSSIQLPEKDESMLDFDG